MTIVSLCTSVCNVLVFNNKIVACSLIASQNNFVAFIVDSLSPTKREADLTDMVDCLNNGSRIFYFLARPRGGIG